MMNRLASDGLFCSGISHCPGQFTAQIASIFPKNEEEFIEFLAELTLYIGRLNYWLDQSMPWYEIVQAYESVMERL